MNYKLLNNAFPQLIAMFICGNDITIQQGQECIFPPAVGMVPATADTAAVCFTADCFCGTMNLKILKLWKIMPKVCTETKYLIRSL